ncbi:MAG: hypothetical protein WAN48_10625 [Actinomycetes bacterium]
MSHRGRVVGIAAAVVVVLVGIGVVAGPSVALRLMHLRNEAAFRDYVSTYVGDWGSSENPNGPALDRIWVRTHPDLVQAEGDRACEWLARQPKAPRVDPSGDTSVGAMMTRYRKETRSTSREIGLAPTAQGTIVSGAWAYLCWWDRRTHTAPRTLTED